MKPFNVNRQERFFGSKVSVMANKNLLIHIAVFALTGGFISITFKWCHAAGWQTAPMALAFYRAAGIGLVYLVIVLMRRDAMLPRGRARGHLIAASLLKTVTNAITVWLLVWLDASFLTVLYACLYPVFSLAMTRVANPVNDKLTRGRVIGCVLGGMAAALMGFKDFDSPDGFGSRAFFYVSVMCFAAALHVIVERKAIEFGATHLQSMLAVSLYTAPGFLLMALVFGEQMTAAFSTSAGVWTLLVCTIVGIAHFGSRRECMGQSQVSGFLLIGYVPHLVTVGAAVIILGEFLDWTTVLGLFILPVALWIGWNKREQDPD
jgi:drug/metabolite transporter (DMT)-like permease